MSPEQLMASIRQRVSDAEQAIDMSHAHSSIPKRPLTSEELEEAESQLGFPLPAFLRRLYLEIGDGGFGPGYGLIAVHGEPTIHDFNLVELYQQLTADDPPPPESPWPKSYLIIADWGCGIVTLLNWQNGAVARFNGDHHQGDDPWEQVIIPEASSLEEWFQDWLTRPGRERFSAYRSPLL